MLGAAEAKIIVLSFEMLNARFQAVGRQHQHQHSQQTRSDVVPSSASVVPSPSLAQEHASYAPWAAGSSGVDHEGPAQDSSNPTAPFPGCVVSQPFPLPQHQNLPSPLHEFRPELNTTIDFAANLPPSAPSLPSPPLVKARHNLRLPPFDLLGIGAPHPDRVGLRSSDSLLNIGSGPLSKPDDPLHALSPDWCRPQQLAEVDLAAMPSPGQVKPHVDLLIPTVTPPAEPGTFNWGAFVNIRTAGMGSPPTSEPGALPTTGAVVDGVTAAPAQEPALSSLTNIIGEDSWIHRAESVILMETLSGLNTDSVKVLSHALPCPSRAGHVFPIIIDAIHRQTPVLSTAWINVFHAVPGRFNLADLPTSPPTTPGPAVGGDEYFTSKVFDSAVAVSEYQGDSKLLPPSPRPVVPPCSVNVSVVERYIPPTNTQEFSEMFFIKGRSLLADRMVELSAQHGTLLFIYPTKTGARTFMREYLGPILDPFLRSLAVMHSLSADFCSALGQMGAVNQMLEYDVLHDSLVRFCNQVSSCSLGQFQNEDCRYSLIYASKEEVKLERDVWAKDWWIKQEKQRIRTAVAKHTRPAQKSAKVTTETEASPTHLIQEILDSVATKGYEDAEPETGVEVGVFIIRKSG